jgi:class 3 adenylate cyclase/tetratricopeptide (TPR) repeat protein
MPTSRDETSYRPYVPLLVRQWLDTPDPDTTHRTIEGSFVFADISGFTRLSERLDRIGLEGAEQVTEVIGGAFNRLLDPAYAFGGTLVKFGGDALLLFYRGARHELRAASAALEMRRALRSLGPIDTPAGKVVLRMSQGVHSGGFDFFLVGSSFREFIVAGAAATHVHTVEGAAGAGQIVVSSATALALPAANLGPVKGSGRLLRGALLPLEESTQTSYEVDHDLTCFVPSALREPIRRRAVVSEHRPATNAFIRFSGVDALLADDPGAVTGAFADLIEDIQEAVEPRRIAVVNTDVYPDGLKIHLCAGAPVATGEDEENMLLAVRDIADRARPLPLHVGITRGPVFAGDVGTYFRRGYAVMGDQVNLAARLMARAGPNQILATEEVLLGSRTVFAAEQLEPFLVKGKKKPITAFVVGDPQGSRANASGRDAPFVGREKELAQLQQVWNRTSAGAGSHVYVEGDTGSGKSRLMEEFCTGIDSADVYVAVCRRYRESTPYFAATLLLGEVLDIDRSAKGRTERLTRRVTETAPELLPYLALLGTALGIDIEDSPEVAALEGEFRKSRLEQSVADLLAASLPGPAVFWVDDAHWLDDASRDLLSALAREGDRPWLLCLSGRSLEATIDGGNDVTITLGPLDDADATSLVHRCTDEAPLPDHVTAAIVERAAGNPMFLNELIAAAGATAVEALPESIEGVISSRIDRLLPDDRNTLRMLSVLGTGFRAEHAGAVLEADPSPAIFHRLGDFLDVDAGWVKFGSTLVHQAAYRGLPYRQRRRLHEAVAESIERTQGSAALLSVHYSAAARWPKVWQYARVAGDLSKRIYANLEAANFYEQALEAARHVPGVTVDDRIGVLTALGEVRYAAGLYEQAGGAFRRARRSAQDPVDVAALCLKEAQVAHKRGRYSQALRWTTRGHQVLAGADTTAADAQRARLKVWTGIMRYEQGRYQEAMAAAEQAIEEAKRAGDLMPQARAYYLYDAARVWSGRPGSSDYSRRALAIYEELGDLREQAVVLGNLATFAYMDGRWTEAAELYERSRETHLKTGNPVEAARAEENLGELLCDRGNLADAEVVLTNALRVWKAANNPAEAAFVQCQLGRVASRNGRYEQAAATLAEARQGFLDLGARYDSLDVRTRIVENMVFAGSGERALHEIADTLAEAEGFGEGIHITRLQLMLGYASAQSGGLEAGLSHVEEALALARRRNLVYEIALCLEAQTRLRHLLGRDGWDEGLEEIWSIQETLGIVSIPRVPLHQLEPPQPKPTRGSSALNLTG